MPRTLPARPRPSHTSPRTSSVRPPMRSRPHVLPRRKERARAQGDSSAGGSATSSRRRFASSYSTTSGCGTTSAGRCSTAESASGRQHCPTSASSGRREPSGQPKGWPGRHVVDHLGAVAGLEKAWSAARIRLTVRMIDASRRAPPGRGGRGNGRTRLTHKNPARAACFVEAAMLSSMAMWLRNAIRQPPLLSGGYSDGSERSNVCLEPSYLPGERSGEAVGPLLRRGEQGWRPGQCYTNLMPQHDVSSCQVRMLRKILRPSG